MPRDLSDADYQRLLEFRDGLRRFERWSDTEAAAVGLTPAHHQLLLTIKGHGSRNGPTVGEIAEHLLLRHHSAVGLVDRAVAAGLVKRRPDPDDHRVVRVCLTATGSRRLAALASLHAEELARLRSRTKSVWHGLDAERG